jgi:hypothetical protein
MREIAGGGDWRGGRNEREECLSSASDNSAFTEPLHCVDGCVFMLTLIHDPPPFPPLYMCDNVIPYVRRSSSDLSLPGLGTTW